MTIKTENKLPAELSHEDSVADMAPLIKRVHEFLKERQDKISTSVSSFDLNSLSQQFHFTDKKNGTPEVILAEDVAIELGHPSTASQALVLISYQPQLVHHGQISIVGEDLNSINNNKYIPFAQIVLLSIDPDLMPDPFDLENTQFLMHRLPGYMVRSIPGKLWVRISKKGRKKGLTLKTVGTALTAAYTNDFKGVTGVEVAFITSSKGDVEALAQLAMEANILFGRHKKLALGIDGEVECTELNCERCDEKPVCDSLRDVIIKRRKNKC